MSFSLYAKFKLYPNKTQTEKMNRIFAATRFVFNDSLAATKELAAKNEKIPSDFDLNKKLPVLKKTVETEWISAAPSESLQVANKNLNLAWKKFFRDMKQKKIKFDPKRPNRGKPKFKSWKDRYDTFYTTHIKIKGNRVYISKFTEGIKFSNHRAVNGTLKHAVVVRDNTGTHWIAINYITEPVPLPAANKNVGIDLNIKNLAVCSDGENTTTFENPKHYNRLKERLAKEQQRLALKKKGSNHYERQRLVVAKVMKKISNCRNNYHHDISAYIVKNHDIIVAEDLSVKEMVEKPKTKGQTNKVKSSINRQINDAGWYSLVQQIDYKSKLTGRQFIKIGRYFPSSQLCFSCGYKNKNLTLQERAWICPKCETLVDRDVNAAKNILAEGLRQQQQQTEVL